MGSKGFVLIPEVIDFEALSDLCPHMIVDHHEVGKIFGNLGDSIGQVIQKLWDVIGSAYPEISMARKLAMSRCIQQCWRMVCGLGSELLSYAFR